jgi:hypothetical protein
MWNLPMGRSSILTVLPDMIVSEFFLVV